MTAGLGAAHFDIRQATLSMSSPYSQTIDAVRDALVQRSRNYKRLVIAVSMVGVVVALAAALRGGLAPFLVLTLLPSLALVFFALDLRTVQRWRADVLSHWCEGSINLELLSATARAVPNLPGPTVEGMLWTLPKFNGIEVPLVLRPALVGAQDHLAAIAIRQLVAQSCIGAVAAASAVASWIDHRPTWLAVWPALLLAAVALRRHSVRQVRTLKGSLLTSWRDEGIDSQSGSAWLDGLNVRDLPHGLSNAWHAPSTIRR